MNKYQVALIQINTSDQLAENLKIIESKIRYAALQGAKLITMPEVVNLISDSTEPYAEDETGTTYQLISSLAKELGVFIHGGSWSELILNSKKHFNTSFLFDDQGVCIGKYRKIHTFDIVDPLGKTYRESDSVESGNEIAVIDTKLGKLGMAICYDLRFPELYRLMALQGADLILNPANFTMMTGKDHWEPLLKARAIENGVYMVAANQFGQNKRMLAYGNSMVINPWGQVIARADDQPEVLFATIDFDFLKAVRARMQTLENRRHLVYRLDETGK
ncbi:carbon-nitrogen hydrolase family protein [Enterococcus sp. MMGLQ5-2]|nr:carbon-nitrogen hydrolase family protein [Enterococcus sp. MMGLQ5-1]NPD36570.1 carbon-nitrogen hydrolase family protein [Enterococcus sp. MMGLQ5-2]